MVENSPGWTRRNLLKRAGAAGTLALSGVAGCLDETAGGGDGDDDDETANWTLGTSSEGSSSFRIGSTFSEYLKQEGYTDTFELDAVVTPGTSATYRMVDNQEVEIGGTTTQLLSDSPDEGSLEDEPLENFDSMRQVRGYMSFYNFALGDTESGIEGWDDLDGKAIAISSPGSATRAPAEWLVDQEIGLDNVETRYMAFADIPSALRGGRADAAFTWATNGEIPQGWFQEIDSTVEWTPLPISDETKDKIESDLAYSSNVQVDAGTISENRSESIDAFTLTYLWCTLADRDPEVVYEIARLSHELGEELTDRDEVMGFFPDPDKFLGTIHPDIPVHKGAYDYYTEAGIWDDYDLTAPPEADD